MKKSQQANEEFFRRYLAIRKKIGLLSSLRGTVSLSPNNDITDRQWTAIELPLLAMEAKLFEQLKEQSRRYLSRLHQPKAKKELNRLIGKISLSLSDALMYFDTFVDLLSQRHLPEVGLLLGGCDVLAYDALDKKHPALTAIEPPLVSFNRGFGASILREGVAVLNGKPNPIPAITIPYTKIKAKYNLTSIIHEAGHEAMVRLGLLKVLPLALSVALSDAGASRQVQKLFALWVKEIAPDFWGFCNCGAAQASSIREILRLPPHRVYWYSFSDPHPSPWLRVLLCFEWCRQVWGRGDWDDWEKEWISLYPLEEAPARSREILKEGKRFLPLIASVLLRSRFKVLDRKTILSLFDLNDIAPHKLEGIIMTAKKTGILDISGFSPCGQLALFRTLRDKNLLTEKSLDRLMTKWLILLSKSRKIKE